MLSTGDKVTILYNSCNVIQTKMIVSKRTYDVIKYFNAIEEQRAVAEKRHPKIMKMTDVIVVGSPLWFAVQHEHAPLGCYVLKIGDKHFSFMINKLHYEKVGG